MTKQFFEKKFNPFLLQRFRNLNFEEKARALGAAWNEENKKWIAHELAEKEFKQLESYYFDNMKVVEVEGNFEIKEVKNNISANDFYKVYLCCAGYVLAYATGRDSGAKKSKDIVVLSGGFVSAGSAKNYYCAAKKDTKVRMKMSQSALDEISQDAELSKRYKIFLCDSSVSMSVEKEALDEFVTDEEILKALKILSKVSKDRVKDIIDN